MSGEFSIQVPVHMSRKEFESKCGFNSIPFAMQSEMPDGEEMTSECGCPIGKLEPSGLGNEMICTGCGLVMED